MTFDAIERRKRRNIASRKYRLKNLKKIKLYSNKYREKNKLTLRKKHRTFYSKRYYEKNKKMINKKRRERYVNSPEFRLQDLARRNTINRMVRESKCILCKSKKYLNFHHISYSPIKVITVCSACHKGIHLGKIKVN